MRSSRTILAVLCGVSFWCSSPLITLALTPLEVRDRSISQQPNNADAETAKKLVAEAQELIELGTAVGKQQAIEKFKQARIIWQKLGEWEQEATALLSIGTLYYIQNNSTEALKYFQEGLAVEEKTNNRLGIGVFNSSIGNAYSVLGETQKAIDYYNIALPIFQQKGDVFYQGTTLTSLGSAYNDLGQTEKAIDYYNQALIVYEKNNDTDNLASTLNYLGLLYTNNGETQKAIDTFNRALTIQQKAGNTYGEAEILQSLALIYTSTGNTQKSLELLQQALKLQQGLQGKLSGVQLTFNLTSQGITLVSLGSSYLAANEYNKSIESFTQARSLFQQTGQSGFEADSLYNLNFIYTTIGETQKALDSLEEALAIYQKNNAPAQEATVLSQMGEIYNDIGEPQQAIDLHERALVIVRKIGNREKESVILNDLAQVYANLGDDRQAIEISLESVKISTAIGNLTHKGQTLNSIATNYRNLRDYPQAIEYYNQALAIWRNNNDLLNLLSSLTGIVRVYEAQKEYDQGFAAANEIITKSREQKNSFGEGSGYSMLGRLYNSKGDYEKGLENALKAREIFLKIGFNLAEVNVLNSVSLAYQKLGQNDKAIATQEEELKLHQKLGDRFGEADTQYRIALLERERDNLNAAIERIKASISIVEDVRTKVTSQELRRTYFASVQKYYELYIDLLMQQDKKEPNKGYNALALQISERARARGLLEILTLANADITSGVDAALLKQKNSLEQKIQAAQKRLTSLSSSNSNPEQLKEANSELTSLTQQYQTLQTKIRTDSPHYAALTQPQPIDLQQIQQQVLDRDTVLLQYNLGDDRSYLWLVTQDSISSYELPPRATIKAAVDNYRSNLTNPEYKISATDTLGATLSQILIQPVASQLENKRLLIVADGALQYLPFSALPVKDKNDQLVPLLIQNEIVTSPSTSTLAVLRRETQNRQPASKTLAILADPVFNSDDSRLQTRTTQNETTSKQSLSRNSLDRSIRDVGATLDRLPGTRIEAQDILKLVPADRTLQAFDFDANLSQATDPELSQYRIIHFATHGIVNNQNPELSGIVLSLVNPQGETDDGFLQLEKIYNLNLPAELVVLSACETGLGEEIKGEGIVGLTRGFMYAGTPRVVVSLWSVADEATAELMTEFYQGMLQQDLTPAAALRQAQITLWQEKKWDAPFFWAAFTLQGEWK
jgi:CHAT domain-containing protein/Tfp pilus assembly protein PilF